MKNNCSLPDNYTPDAMRAIADYIMASDRNAKEPDETWADGFKTVQQALDRLHTFLSEAEVSAIIINSTEIRKVLSDAGLIGKENNFEQQ